MIVVMDVEDNNGEVEDDDAKLDIGGDVDVNEEYIESICTSIIIDSLIDSTTDIAFSSILSISIQDTQRNSRSIRFSFRSNR